LLFEDFLDDPLPSAIRSTGDLLGCLDHGHADSGGHGKSGNASGMQNGALAGFNDDSNAGWGCKHGSSSWVGCLKMRMPPAWERHSFLYVLIPTWQVIFIEG
jgi:hypothetical protein